MASDKSSEVRGPEFPEMGDSAAVPVAHLDIGDLRDVRLLRPGTRQPLLALHLLLGVLCLVIARGEHKSPALRWCGRISVPPCARAAGSRRSRRR